MTITAKAVQALRGDARSDLTIMARKLMKEFGGPEGLAESIYDDFKKATPGGVNRLKIELAVVSLLERFALEDDELPDDDEQLEALARSLQP